MDAAPAEQRPQLRRGRRGRERRRRRREEQARDERRRDERKRSRSRDRQRRRDRGDDARGRPARREEKPPKPEKRDDSSKSRSLSWSPPPAVRRQMAEAKARKQREAAAIAAGEIQPAQNSGKFWDGFRWVEHTPASQLPSNPATRKERRLYVGNLPQTFDGEQLRIFLNEALRACGAIPAGVDEGVRGMREGGEAPFEPGSLTRGLPLGHQARRGEVTHGSTREHGWYKLTGWYRESAGQLHSRHLYYSP